MTSIQFHWEFTIITDLPDDEIMEQVERVVDELVHLEDDCLSDTAVSLDLGARTVLVEVVSSGEDFFEAQDRGSSCIRSAIHAAGGSTPDWPVFMRPTRLNTEIAGRFVDA